MLTVHLTFGLYLLAYIYPAIHCSIVAIRAIVFSECQKDHSICKGRKVNEVMVDRTCSLDG